MKKRPLTDQYTRRIVRDMEGAEVRRIRLKLGFTQAQLAEKVGVASNTVARWERGELGIGEPAARLMRLLAQMPTATRRNRSKGKR